MFLSCFSVSLLIKELLVCFHLWPVPFGSLLEASGSPGKAPSREKRLPSTWGKRKRLLFDVFGASFFG